MAGEATGAREGEKALTALGRGDAGGTSRKPLESRDNLNFFLLLVRLPARNVKG